MGGWVQVSFGFFCGKSSQNTSKQVQIFWSSIIPYVFCLYILLKVVRYYDLSVLSMSVMGFKKKKFVWRVDGWGQLYPSLFGISGILLTLQSPLPTKYLISDVGSYNIFAVLKNSEHIFCGLRMVSPEIR